MALREITLGDQAILVEVADLEVEGQAPGGAGEGFEYTSLSGEVGDVKDRIYQLVKTLAAPIREALKDAAADEWSLKVCLGFKGQTGLPFIASGEANAAVKVTAKWKKGP